MSNVSYAILRVASPENFAIRAASWRIEHLYEFRVDREKVAALGEGPHSIMNHGLFEEYTDDSCRDWLIKCIHAGIPVQQAFEHSCPFYTRGTHRVSTCTPPTTLRDGGGAPSGVLPMFPESGARE